MSKRTLAASPRRSKRIRRAHNYSKIARLLIEGGECCFRTLCALWQTAKLLQPYFNHTRFYFVDALERWVFGNSLEEWKIYYNCFANRAILQDHLTPYDSSTMANMLIVYGHVAMASKLIKTVELHPNVVIPSLYINGKFDTYAQFLKTLSVEAALQFEIVAKTNAKKPPLYSYELLDAFDVWGEWSQTRFLTYILRFIDDAVTVRSVVGLDWIRLKLEQPLPVRLRQSYLAIYLKTGEFLITKCGNLEIYHAARTDAACRLWGHERALQIADSFLKHIVRSDRKNKLVV